MANGICKFYVVTLQNKSPKLIFMRNAKHITALLQKITSLIALLFVLSATPLKGNNPDKPNIILFYVDDLGWMDVGFQGSEFYETPALDNLASQGMSFTDAYTAFPRCVPARYGLITGRYPSRAAVPGGGKLFPEDYTLAEALQAGGYKTFFAGKWHLLFDFGLENMPENQGFDVNVAGGASGAPPTYWYPYRVTESTEEGQLGLTKKELHGLDSNGIEGEYITDRLTRESVDFMENHINNHPEQPFFLYLSHYGVHTPFEAQPELVAKYEEKLKTMEYDLPEYDSTRTGDSKLRQDFPVYAAMIESVDNSMQALQEALTELGIEENTIIIFTSDNGGLSTRGNDRQLATSNYPLRTGKGWVYEGGIREPFVVKWPGQTEAGSISSALTMGTDIYPTILEMAGLPQRPNDHLDGESIVSALKGENFTRTKPLFWHSPKGRPTRTGDLNSSAIRIGKYKLIDWYDEGFLELFDMENDISETTDLSKEMPEQTKALKHKLDSIRIELLNWEPVDYDTIAVQLPFIDDFEGDHYTPDYIFAGNSNEISSDSWIPEAPMFYNGFVNGEYTHAYSCAVIKDPDDQNNQVLKISINSKAGSPGFFLQSAILENGLYNINLKGKTDLSNLGIAKIGSNDIKENMTELTSEFKEYSFSQETTSDSSGAPRLDILYFTETNASSDASFTIYLDDLVVDKSDYTNTTDNKFSNEPYFYPNPVSDYLHLNSNIVISKLIIVNALGKIVQEQQEATSPIDVRNLRPGLYIICFKHNNVYHSSSFSVMSER
jgi:arylsulfatase A-like enzyme